jgi:hypothetical protein
MMPRQLGSALLLLIPTPLLGVQEGQPVELTDIDLGAQVVGVNSFRADLTNRRDTAIGVVLDLRAMPGMWFRRNMQGQFWFEVGARETQSIEAEYTFERMSPEAVLRVRVGPGHRSEEGFYVQDSVWVERRFPVGEGNPSAVDLEEYFEIARRGPLEIYAWRESLAASRIQEIAETRLAAVAAVREILNVDPPERIRLVFYPDSATKTSQTRHIGAGWAFGTTIVEIYNDQMQLDPYHELAHVLAAGIGDPPAMFNEGFAVYVSERLGADALAQLGSPGRSVGETVCGFLRDGTAFTFEELSALEDIGTTESRPFVSYPQSASVMKFLVDTYGLERFRATYRAAAEAEGTAAERSEAAFGEALGASTAEVGRRWRAAAEGICR